LQLLPGER